MEIALIGCGRIGALLEDDPLRYKPCTHFGGTRSAGIPVTLACDLDGKRLRDFSLRAGLSADRLYVDYRALLAERSPDAVIIATWTASHVEIAVAAIEKGVRVIVLEKPVASSVTESSRLCSIAASAGARVIVNHERRYDARYRHALKLVKSGAIGDVRTAQARVLTGPFRGKSVASMGGGPLLHDGTHLADMLRFFLGEAEWVIGEFGRDSRRSGFEDRATGWIRMKNGSDVFLEAGGSRKYFHFDIELWGTRGRISVGNGFESLYTARDSRFYSGYRDLAEDSFTFRRNNCFSELYREVRKMLEGGRVRAASTVADGHGALEIIDAIYLSSHKAGSRIYLPLDPSLIDIKKIFDL